MQRTFSSREENWNAITHGIGCLAAIAALPILILQVAGRGDTPALLGCIVFGLVMSNSG